MELFDIEPLALLQGTRFQPEVRNETTEGERYIDSSTVSY